MYEKRDFLYINRVLYENNIYNFKKQIDDSEREKPKARNKTKTIFPVLTY